jgi:vacuolar-type H+-ATPase subunit H
VDSKLISLVNDLESEAERHLQEARDQSVSIQRESERSRARLNEEKQKAAKLEAEQLLLSSRQNTREEMELRRAEQKASLSALLHRGEARLEKASKLILDRLGKL